MTFYRITKQITPILLLIGFTGFFTGNKAYYVSGLSPFFYELARVETNAFRKTKALRQTQKKNHDGQIRDHIEKIISNYHTGLDKKIYLRVPGWILAESKKYGYDPLFLTALIITESSFYNWAKSKRGARGLMQLKPATAVALASETSLNWKGTRTLYDPKKNIALGAYYLNKMVARFGNLSLALEAYNHGPSRLRKYLRKGYQPKRYSRKVLKNYKKISFQPI